MAVTIRKRKNIPGLGFALKRDLSSPNSNPLHGKEEQMHSHED